MARLRRLLSRFNSKPEGSVEPDLFSGLFVSATDSAMRASSLDTMRWPYEASELYEADEVRDARRPRRRR